MIGSRYSLSTSLGAPPREELPVAAAPYITFRLGFTEKFSLGVFMTELEKTSPGVIGIAIPFRVTR